MKIDGTRTKAFWSNPERYRLAYECNLTPAVTGYALQRGIAMHTALDLAALNYPHAAMVAVLKGKILSSDGRLLELADSHAAAMGLALAEAYLAKADTYEVIESELEFDFRIDGSEHRGVGRLDQIIKLDDGKLWLLEFKSGSSKTSRSRKEEEWLSDLQADFEILGARSAGYEVEGVRVQYVLEMTPPRVWEPLLVSRSDAQLQRSKLFIHQTCETVEMYRATFGLEQPWPHLANWPCTGDASYCGYQNICGCEGPLTVSRFKGFKLREEHLALLRQK